MAKHLVEIDEGALSAARAELGTDTPEDTVNEALRLVAADRASKVAKALDVLARAPLDGRDQSWRADDP